MTSTCTCNYSPRDHALQNQKGAKLCDQHEKGTHVVMQSHLGASVPSEASNRECKKNHLITSSVTAYRQIKYKLCTAARFDDQHVTTYSVLHCRSQHK